MNNLYVCPSAEMKTKLVFSLGIGFMLITWMFSTQILWSQEPYAIPLNRSNGLPSISVYQCHQDKQGFIWLASDVGLTRYDGFHFQTFKNEAQTAFSGSCIHEDDFGRIWYQNFDGYNYYYDRKKDELQSLSQKSSVGYLQFGFNAKHFFHISPKGIEVFDLNSLNPKKTIKLNLEIPQHTTFAGENFYLIDADKIYKVDSELNLSQSKSPFSRLSTKLIFKLNQDTLVHVQKYNEENKLYYLSSNLKQLSSISIPDIKHIHTINFVDDKLWICSPNGIYVFSKTGKLLNHYFKNLSISGVMKDRQHNYWISTTNQGIFIVPNLQNKFLFGSDKLPNKVAKIDEYRFLVSTKKGELFLVNQNFEIIKTLVNAPENGEIYFLHYDVEDKIISYTSNGFYQIDLEGKLLYNNSFAIKALVRLDTKYWAYASSNSSGLLEMQHAKNKSSYWDQIKTNSYHDGIAEVLNNRARSLAFDSINKKLYFATNGGLFEIDVIGKREIKKDGQTFFASKLIFFNENLFALSTKGSLYRIDKSGNFELMNAQYDIEEYDIKYCALFENSLILASSSFVHNIDLQSNEHSLFNVNVSSYDINDILFEGKDLFLLTNEGVIKTSIQNDFSKYVLPNFKIAAFISKDSAFDVGKPIKLNYSNDEVTVHYAILDFGNTIPLDLCYRINNGEWQITSRNSRELNFPSLKSGNYKIEFKLGNEILEDKVEFSLLAPWWKRPWFIVLVLFVVSCLAYVFYRNRVNALSRQNMLLEENIRLEKNLRNSILTTIKSQMNPHFLYNALNTIQAYIYTNDKENAGKYLLKFSKLTRRVLEMSEKEKIELSEEITTIQLYLDLEKARFEDDFSFEMDTSRIKNLEHIKIPPMLIQPYIENAIKHGLLHKNGQKELRIFFIEESDYLLVKIDDNGIGRKRSAELNQNRNKQHQSFASEANSKRLEVLNYGKTNKVSVEIKDKIDAYNMPTGTLVTLHIPIQN
jgi:sensor histidine kinase YesM